jgi:hypothetical protein
MKKIIVAGLFSIIAMRGYAQVLLEDKDGDQIANNSPVYTNSSTTGIQGIHLSLIKLNTGDQSLGFNYISTTKNFNPANYGIHEFGVKAKPTEGFAAVFSNGQFSPGIRATYSYTHVPLLKDNVNYVDWGGINFSYDLDKFPLYRRDTAYAYQFSSKTFKALNIGVNYNALIKQMWIMNLRAGYSRRNNYEDLNSVEVQEMSSIVDPTSSAIRQIIEKRSAKEGRFEEFDAYPLIIAFTKATSSDDPNSPNPAIAANAKKLKLGFTLYLKNLTTKDLPKTDAGVIFFLTQQDNKQNNGVRIPVFGINIQANDPFDVKNLNNGLQQRLTVGFTTIFSL